MPDSLYVSLWYPSFEHEEILTRALSVIRQFPFSAQRPGVTYVSLHPVDWDQPTVLERRFSPGIPPEEAILVASDLLHDDYAYLFEASWDLWTPAETGGAWVQGPATVKVIAHGVEFEEGAYEQEGHIQVDFGLDTSFLQEEMELTDEADLRVRANVTRLIEFVTAAEKSSGARTRLLWSESGENLAQKLVRRLQKVN